MIKCHSLRYSNRLARVAVLTAVLSSLFYQSAALAQSGTQAAVSRTAPRLGAFEHSLFGPYDVVMEDQLDTSKYWGVLRHTDTVPGLWLRDDDGISYSVTNSFYFPPDNKSIVAAPWMGGQKTLSNGQTEQDPQYKPWSGAATLELTADKQLKWTVGNEELIYGTSTAQWHAADGSIKLSGTLATPVGVQFLFPWRKPDGITDIMYFTTHLYKVDGTYHGKAVKGFLSIDNNWGNVGYRDNWWVRNRVGHWLFFANEYDDGQVETGYLVCGKYGDRGVSFVDSKGQEVFKGDKVGVYPELDAGGKTNRIVYTSDKDPAEWEFVQDPKVAARSMGAYQFGKGLVARVGEKRKVVRSIGTYITYGGGLPPLCSPPRAMK